MIAVAKRKPKEQQSLIDEIDQTRLEQIWKPFWANYAEGTRALKHLERLLKQPRSFRPQSTLITADPAAGKTAIALQFVKSMNPEFKLEDEERQMPVVYVQAPPDGRAAVLYTSILDAVNAPYSPSWQINKKQHEAFQMLTKLNTRMLIVDELHHMLAGHTHDREVFMNVLKQISSTLEISIVGIGTQNALKIMNVDEQFSSRFEPYRLPKWEPDEAYLRFLVLICKHARFKGSIQPKRKAFVRRIHTLSKGLTGETWKLMCRLIEYAETQGHEQLTTDMMDKVGWVMPGERRWLASRKHTYTA